MTQKAFTLIELLIVVAIIAILAAIAVPNFLEAQVRAKVARVKNDLRTMATTLESYQVDNNGYPPRGIYTRDPANGRLVQQSPFVFVLDPIIVTTPIAYITSEASMFDPFEAHTLRADRPKLPVAGDWAIGRFRYTASKQVLTNSEATQGILTRRFGGWRIAGAGPDKQVFNDIFNDTNWSTTPILIPYDPTNGTVSIGDILRSQKEADVSLASTLIP